MPSIDGAGEESPEYMAEHVREAIAQEPRLGELHVHVAVVGRRVVLTGDVATEERRKVVGEVVRRLLPSWDVANQTTVVPLPEAPKVERLP
jgi:osmotically-inducible protein OsmY